MKIVNKKAYFNFSVEKHYDAGIMLLGSEVKSMRNKDIDFSDSYIVINNGELFLKGMRIAPYKNATFNNHPEHRDRKLLLKKSEIVQILKRYDEKGIAVLPLEIFMMNNKFKLKIGVCKGKRQFDKRNEIREREVKIDIARKYNI